MSWKKFKKIFEAKQPEENEFIVGIDLGNSTSTIAYYDLNKKHAEIMDISGGYGKPSIPTIVQYTAENDEWIFGEYALLNSNDKNDLKVDSMISDLGKNKMIAINNRDIKLSKVLGIFIRELLNNCKNLNPKAVIVGIVVSVPEYLDVSAINELKDAFHYIGFDDFVIEFVEARECVFNYYFRENTLTAQQNLLLIDFGSTSLKASIYKSQIYDKDINLDCLMSSSRPDLADNIIIKMVFKLFLDVYTKNTNKTYTEMSLFEKEQLNAFVYSNKDILFQKNILNKPVKLYYNFIHPPFQHSFAYQDIKNLLTEFEIEFRNFIKKLIESTINNTININDTYMDLDCIDKVICTGGGFEMFWAKLLIKELFDADKINFYKNSKAVVAEGGAILAAEKLNIVSPINLKIKEINLVDYEIGIKVYNKKTWKFYSIIPKNSFWYANFPECIIILNDDIDNSFEMEILKRDKNGKASLLTKVMLINLPKRPKGTTRLKLKCKFIKSNLLELFVEDNGFGEFFSKTEYKQKFLLEI